MTRTNRHPGNCAHCKAHVPSGIGVLTGPPWRVWCADHAPAEPAPRVALALDGDRLIVSLAARVDRDKFDGFRRAVSVSGGSWDRARRANVVPVASAALLVASLKDEGLVIDADAATQDAIDDAAQDAAGVVADAEERADAVDAALQAAGHALYPFQRAGVRWLAARNAALLADDPGLGKTVQALTALPAAPAVVVVCPSVAKHTWRKQAAIFRPELSVEVLSGRGSFRWPARGEIVVVNFEILPGEIKGVKAGWPANLRAPIAQAPAGCVLIVDEAHRVKSSKAAQTKRTRALARACEDAGGKVWLLTASPMPNHPGELWTLLATAKLARPAFGNRDKFVQLFGGTPGRWGGIEWGTPSPDVPKRLQTVMLRRSKTEVLTDLPPKRKQDIEVNGLSAACKRLADRALTALDAIDLEKAAKSAEATAIRGAAFTELSKARAALATAKIPHMLSLVEDYEEAGTPLLVLSAHRAPVEALADREGWALITGDTPAAEKSAIEDAFQAGKLRGIAGTIKACGVSITLTHASDAIFVDLAWTPEDNKQAEDRIYRLGQNRGVLIKRLVADHALDRRVLALLDTKQALIEASVEAAVRGADDALDEAEVASGLAQAGMTVAIDAGRVAAEGKAAPAVKTDNGPGHGPQTARETWAANGLLKLAALDPDRAREQNGVGFNGRDGEFGHSLAAQLCDRLTLTPKQWRAAIKMLRKYHRQIGPCPEGE